jgi:hypothetical protein
MRRTFLWTSLLLMVLVIFFHDIVFSGKSLSTGQLLPGTTPAGSYGFSGYEPRLPFSLDTGGTAWINEPNPYIIRRTLNEGAFPLWNPRDGLGMPLVGNVNTEVFNFLKTFLNLSPGPFSQDMFYLLRLFIMGVFTYLFLAEKKLTEPASFFGASFFMLSGYSLWWINLHPLSTVMYLPPAFYFYERWLNRKDRLSPCLLALSICMSIFGGKFPDVVMGTSLLGLYALTAGFFRGGIQGALSGAGRITAAVSAGVLLSSVVLFPFFELYAQASPMAKAIRTGAASHTLPLISSVSLWQPLFLGLKNIYYSGWLQKEFLYLLPYAGVVVLLHLSYTIISPGLLKKTLPFAPFALFLFMQIYGLVPDFFVVNRPLLGSMNFQKYSSMLYFSLAVITAHTFDAISEEKKRSGRFSLSLILTAALFVLYCLFLLQRAPADITTRLFVILGVTIGCLAAIGAAHHFFGGPSAFRVLMIAAMLGELFLYMPKDHPDRVFPYYEPPYLNLMQGQHPYRIVGDGASVPPLVSNAIGLYDSRCMDLLMQGDYYSFFEHLIGFSVPYTSDPDALVAATSPWTDLLGVRYILSTRSFTSDMLSGQLRQNAASLRWIRLFESMVSHRIAGTLDYGIVTRANDRRFSFSFPLKFEFVIRMRVTEPFFFAGFTLEDVPRHANAIVKIVLPDRVHEVILKEGEAWQDHMIDLSGFMGKEITVSIQGAGRGGGRVIMGNSGLSPGYTAEKEMHDRLFEFHKREYDFLSYKGVYAGLHLYENRNVFSRAFMLHHAKMVSDLGAVIRALQNGVDFRSTALFTDLPSHLEENGARFLDHHEKIPIPVDTVTIRAYASDSVTIDVISDGGVLVLSDLYYPGWKARVNGREEPVIKVFGIFRGVFIEKGQSEVVFEYRPFSFYAGAALSLTALIALVIFAFSKKRRDA